MQSMYCKWKSDLFSVCWIVLTVILLLWTIFLLKDVITLWFVIIWWVWCQWYADYCPVSKLYVKSPWSIELYKCVLLHWSAKHLFNALKQCVEMKTFSVITACSYFSVNIMTFSRIHFSVHDFFFPVETPLFCSIVVIIRVNPHDHVYCLYAFST